MAFYKNREVALLGPVDGSTASPTYAVLHKDGNREHVALDQVELTTKEYEDLRKQHGDHGMFGVKKIEDKDAQELRDSQDREKIEQNQKTKSTEPVAVSKVLVDPKEVSEKTVNTNTEKKAKAK